MHVHISVFTKFYNNNIHVYICLLFVYDRVQQHCQWLMLEQDLLFL